MAKPNKPRGVASRKKMFFFMAAAVAFYKKDDAVKQRHMNALISLEDSNIVEADLHEIQRSLQVRLHAENGVEPKDVEDIVVLNISMLAHTTPDKFHVPTQPTEVPIQ